MGGLDVNQGYLPATGTRGSFRNGPQATDNRQSDQRAQHILLADDADQA